MVQFSAHSAAQCAENVAAQDMLYQHLTENLRHHTHDAAVATSGDIECGCCFSDVPVMEATTMECTHTYCNDCWRQHFKVQISEGNSRRLLCMGVKCGAICDDQQV